jgi:Flp pilus assembly protein TadD
MDKQANWIDPDDAKAHYNLGNAYFESGKYKEAIESYKQAIRINPDLAEAHYNLGVAYSKSGMNKEAIESYKQAIRINPDYAEAHVNLGVAYSKSGMNKEAIESYKQAIRINPDYAEAHVNLGVAYDKSGMNKEATESYKQAIWIDPDLAEAHGNLGGGYDKAGTNKEAIESYKQASRNKLIMISLGICLLGCLITGGLFWKKFSLAEKELSNARQRLFNVRSTYEKRAEEQNEIMWEVMNNRKASDARIDKLLEEISSESVLSNSSYVEIDSILRVMHTIANKYQEPLEEFKGVSDFIHSELTTINVLPDRKRDYFYWLFSKKVRKRILDNYKQKGRKEAFEEAVVKLDTAYQKASITMASYAREIREQLFVLKQINIIKSADRKEILGMLNKARNVLGTNEKVLYLRDEAIEKLPIRLK